MHNEQKLWLSMCATSATALALAGCNEPNGSPAPNASSATEVASTTVHVGVEMPVMNAYKPGQKIVPLMSCNLERVDGVTFNTGSIERPSSQVHSFSGWIAAPQLSKPAYWLRFDNKQANRYFQTRIDPSIARPDVAAIAGNEAFSSDAGFKVDIAAKALATGRYHVYLAAVVGNTAYTCDNGRQVSVAE